MRAAVWRTANEPVVVMDVDLAPPKAGEVEVTIAAAGVCHSDLHLIRGEWEVPTPVILGHEGSGIVTAVGAGVTGLVEGDHVVLSWVPSCGECRYCRLGRTSQCRKAATVTAPNGVLFDGTSRFSIGGEAAYHYCAVSSFSERVVVPASGAIKVRKDAPLDVISLVGCAVSTGVGAVQNTARVEAGATVAVIGCGGVGLCCIQGARLAGASRIVAVDVVASKLDLALSLGATDTVNASEVPVLEALTATVPEGLDYVFDAIGKIETTEQAIGAIGLGGAAVIVGLPPTGRKATFEPLALAEADQRILGSNYGSVNAAVDFPRLVDLFMDGSLDLESLVSARRPLEEAREALDDLAGGHVLRQLLVSGSTHP
ncbi:MAG: Zn-dependent alcohol dehydrogenase [Chloroflexi bacterium]|nr:Zn-dependent alcohol dehydrogenase [Chloroflexota bacterium]